MGDGARTSYGAQARPISQRDLKSGAKNEGSNFQMRGGSVCYVKSAYAMHICLIIIFSCCAAMAAGWLIPLMELLGEKGRYL